MQKKNFRIGQMVLIDNTTSPDLDGQVVEVLGKSFEDITDCYIVMLETPVANRHGEDQKAIVLVEACLYSLDTVSMSPQGNRVESFPY